MRIWRPSACGGGAVASAGHDRIAKQAAAADAEIRRAKAAADIEMAQWKARQWSEIERYKAGLKAEANARGEAAADPACSERSRGKRSRGASS
jgi:hypothetical protein